LNQINGFFSDYFTKARMCNKAGSDVLASLESIVPCKPGSFKYSNTPGDRPPSYKASSFTETVLKCFVSAIANKKIADILKNISDKNLRELITKLSGIGVDALQDYLKSAKADKQGTFTLKYSCNDQKGMDIQAMFSGTLHTPQGDIPVEVPLSKNFSCDNNGIHSWQKGIDIVCGCCPQSEDGSVSK